MLRHLIDLVGRRMDTPYEVVHLPIAGSTQDEARSRCTGRALLVIADAQTAGRGRSGARWEQADRAVAASLAWAPSWPAALWPRLALAAGVAARDAVESRPGGPAVSLEWPNDLVLGGLKVGGIIAEAGGGAVVVGLGLNLWWRRPIEGAGALWQRDPGPGTALRVAEAWAGSLLEVASADPDAWPLERYVEHCVTVGRSITWDGGAGRALGIERDGGLRVDDGEAVVVLHAGAVRDVRA
jgi:BirA family biotin operon repressor/biotin-[acetyl-CoA-carboxylase] ligase